MIQNTVYNIKKIYLLLGSACNFKCIYCVQHDAKPRFKKTMKPEVMKWLEDVAYMLPMKFKPTIHFYGGEPLLYKDTIHEVIDHFGDDFNYLIVSNGSHLTDEDVEYFNKNDVEFILSNDGPNTELTRRVDMWKDDEFVARFNRLKKNGIDAVFSALNQDFYKLFDYIDAKSPKCHISHEDLICNEVTENRLVDFDIPKLLKCYKRMGDELSPYFGKEQFRGRGADTFNRWLKEALFFLRNPEFPDFGVCGAGKSNFAVDMQGNVYLCKNFNTKIGTIEDPYEVLYERAKEETKRLRDSHLEQKGCFECPAFYFCRGGCPFEKPSDEQKKKCDAIRAKWASVVSFIDNRTKLEVKK